MSEQNSQKSSSIKLTAFSVIKKPVSKKVSAPEPLMGAGQVIERAPGQFDIEIGSVPLMTWQKAPDPSDCLIMLYGYRDTIDEIQLRRAECRAIEGEFRFAEIEYDVGYIEPQLVDRAKLKELRFANVMRMTVELQEDILALFASEVAKEGLTESTPMKRIKQIGQRPDLFYKLIASDKDFANIEILVVPVLGSAKASDVVRQVAVVLPKAKPKNITQNSNASDTRLVLPGIYDVPVTA